MNVPARTIDEKRRESGWVSRKVSVYARARAAARRMKEEAGASRMQLEGCMRRLVARYLNVFPREERFLSYSRALFYRERTPRV